MTYRQLEALAGDTRASLQNHGLRLDTRFGEVTCTFTLDVDSSVVVGCTVGASNGGAVAQGGPTLVLREETVSDMRDKASGQTAEVQTGDESFDAKVFIDTEAAEDEVQRWLAAPDVRMTVVELVKMRATIRVDGLAVAVQLSAHATPHLFQLETLRTVGACTARLAVAGPLRGLAVPGRGAHLERYGWWLLASGAIGVFIAHHRFALEQGLVEFLWFVAGGSAVVGATAAGLRRATAGDSGSGRRARKLSWLAFFVGGLWVLALGLTANALFGFAANQDPAAPSSISSGWSDSDAPIRDPW